MVMAQVRPGAIAPAVQVLDWEKLPLAVMELKFRSVVPVLVTVTGWLTLVCPLMMLPLGNLPVCANKKFALARWICGSGVSRCRNP